MKKQGWKYWRGVVIAYSFMLLLLLLFASCKTQKKSVKTIDGGSYVEIEQSTKKDSVVVIKDYKLESDTVSYTQIWDVTIYDTEKEGNPIKAVIHGTTQANTSHKEISSTEEVEEVIFSDTLNVVQRDTIFIKTESEKVVKQSILTQYYGFVFLMIFLGVFIVVVKYVLKNVK